MIFVSTPFPPSGTNSLALVNDNLVLQQAQTVFPSPSILELPGPTLAVRLPIFSNSSSKPKILDMLLEEATTPVAILVITTGQYFTRQMEA